VIFRFDDQLIEDTVGKLQPNQLTVDNLTVDWLRQRITDLETSVKDCQEKQTKIHSESNGKISSSASSLQSSPANINLHNSLNTSVNGSNGSLKDVK
jgi:tyrosine-protein kinase Fer